MNGEHKDPTRLDALVRSERYFTATLLPALLFHQEFGGLRAFMALIDGKACTEHTVHDPAGVPETRQQRREPPSYDWEPAGIELITEFHIARDLLADGVRWIRPQFRGDDQLERESRDAPDVVLVVGQELVVCEGKFFHREPKGKIESQLRSQQGQIAYLFRRRPLRAYCHVALLPDPSFLAEEIGADAIVTWDEVARLSCDVLGKEHYVSVRLRSAVDAYRKQRRPRNWDGENETLEQVEEWCRTFGNDVEVGHTNGADALRRGGYEHAAARRWRWRDASGRKAGPQWLAGTKFLELIEELREARRT